MERIDENGGGVMTKPATFREMGHRRALRDIRNLVDAPPCAVSKRPLEQKNGAFHPRLGVVARRPITRKFAASLALNPQTNAAVRAPDASAMPIPATGFPNAEAAAVDIVDVDELALREETVEPMVEEIEDIEMVDLVEEEEETAPDIDSADSGNPLAAVSYVGDIYSFYFQNEGTACVLPLYMSNQADINERMRAILVDWLIEVHYKFDLMDETLFLTVNIIDRFLAKHTVLRKKLQLVGITAMLLACKYEEVSVPVVNDLILISDRAYTRDEILEMEMLIVDTLQFDMSVPTPYVFMRRFLKAAEFDRQLELLSFYIIELCLVEYEMLRYRPSLLAAAAVYTARCSLSGSKEWTRAFEFHTRYSEDELAECSRLMVGFHRRAGSGKLTGVYRKYSCFKFGCAAKTQPALFLLEPPPLPLPLPVPGQ